MKTAMRFQDRDRRILQAVHGYDGVLARRQLKALFWPGSTWRAMDARLSKLYHNGYLNRPSLDDRRTRPIPEATVWLGWKGALHLATLQGIDIEPPRKIKENQLRRTERHLRERGFCWLREPRWSQLAHDLTVVDVRIAVENAVAPISRLRMQRWINESTFRASPDVVEFEAGNKRRKKGVVPDGYFEVSDVHRKQQGHPHVARFLLEVDMASHDNRSFGIEKAAAGAAYVRSGVYKERFGANAGRWLVVTTGEKRLDNLLGQTERWAESDAGLFYFATFENVQSKNLFADLIWRQVGEPEPIALV